MDEFIREVDEEYRRDQIARIWRRFGGLIVAAAVVAVAGIGGWRYWQYTETRRAEATAILFADAVQLARDGKDDEAEAKFGEIAKVAPGGYRLLSRFRLAAETGKGNAETGAKAFDALASDGSIPASFQDLARLRAAALRLDTSDGPTADRDLERIATPTNPWRHSARELLGLAALKRGDLEAAGRWFDQIVADRAAPAGLRARLEIYSALVAGGPVQPTQ